MQILSNLLSALNVRESPKFTRPNGNRGQETRAMRNTQYNAYLWPNRRNSGVL